MSPEEITAPWQSTGTENGALLPLNSVTFLTDFNGSTRTRVWHCVCDTVCDTVHVSLSPGAVLQSGSALPSSLRTGDLRHSGCKNETNWGMQNHRAQRLINTH